jgi:rhodanese-related sulfurtransferase
VATPHEAAALLAPGRGFACLDVRSADESTYNINGAVNVPIIAAKWRFDASLKRRVPTQTPNAGFLAAVAARFPDKTGTKLVIMCSDGRTRTLAALRALDGAGYTCLIGLRGGFNGFTALYDAKLAVRKGDSIGRDPWKEVEGSDAFAGEQTTGINHCNSFERMDNPDNLLPMRDPVEWVDWEASLAEAAAAAK